MNQKTDARAVVGVGANDDPMSWIATKRTVGKDGQRIPWLILGHAHPSEPRTARLWRPINGMSEV